MASKDRTIQGPEDESLTAEEAARWLKLSKATFLKMVALRQLPSGVRVNKQTVLWSWEVVYSMRHLLAFLSRIPPRPATGRPARKRVKGKSSPENGG